MKKILFLMLLSISSAMADVGSDIIDITNAMRDCYNRDIYKGILTFGTATAAEAKSVLKIADYMEQYCPKEYNRINTISYKYSEEAVVPLMYFSTANLFKLISNNMRDKADKFTEIGKILIEELNK